MNIHYEEGFQAYVQWKLNKIEYPYNPYELDTQEYKDWDDGFSNGKFYPEYPFEL